MLRTTVVWLCLWLAAAPAIAAAPYEFPAAAIDDPSCVGRLRPMRPDPLHFSVVPDDNRGKALDLAVRVHLNAIDIVDQRVRACGGDELRGGER